MPGIVLRVNALGVIEGIEKDLLGGPFRILVRRQVIHRILSAIQVTN